MGDSGPIWSGCSRSRDCPFRDKKVRAGKIRWILPRRVGRFSEVTDVPDRTLRAAARAVEGA